MCKYYYKFFFYLTKSQEIIKEIENDFSFAFEEDENMKYLKQFDFLYSRMPKYRITEMIYRIADWFKLCPKYVSMNYDVLDYFVILAQKNRDSKIETMLMDKNKNNSDNETMSFDDPKEAWEYMKNKSSVKS